MEAGNIVLPEERLDVAGVVRGVLETLGRLGGMVGAVMTGCASYLSLPC